MCRSPFPSCNPKKEINMFPRWYKYIVYIYNYIYYENPATFLQCPSAALENVRVATQAVTSLESWHQSRSEWEDRRGVIPRPRKNVASKSQKGGCIHIIHINLMMYMIEYDIYPNLFNIHLPMCGTWQGIDELRWVGGWPTPLKNDGVKVSLDDDIPNMMGKS